MRLGELRSLRNHLDFPKFVVEIRGCFLESVAQLAWGWGWGPPCPEPAVLLHTYKLSNKVPVISKIARLEDRYRAPKLRKAVLIYGDQRPFKQSGRDEHTIILSANS